MDYPKGATPLDPDEMEGLKFPHIQTRGELDELEQQNIQEGYNWLTRQRKYKDLLSEDFSKALHDKLLGLVWSWAGHFRQSEKNIGIDPLNIPVELRTLLDDAKFWVENDTYGREEFAARFHHRLVKIHSFPNGNGRHARIMTDVILEKILGVAAINWGSDSLVKDGEHRKIYINALRAADDNNYQALIEFVSK
ncbi:MAG: mobile mystery protein B [Thiohalomonadales bacterium]